MRRAIHRLCSLVALTMLAGAGPAFARPVLVDSPAGQAGRAAIALARQTGGSIVIADRALAERRVPAIRGRMEPHEAARRLAQASGGRLVRAGDGAWRIIPAAPAAASRANAAPSPPVRSAPPPVEEPPAEAAPGQIVVTASKRDLSLDQYAGQASFLPGEELIFGGVGGTERIMQRLPTLSSTHLGSGRNKLFIRGIADSSFTGPTQATVGQYLGDLRLTYNAPDPDLRLSDMELVEVLEGPQGTLYGSGSMGGIIRMVPNAPELGVTYGAAILGGSQTWHGAAGMDANLVLNLPFLVDDAALRISLDTASEGGYIDKPLLGRRDVNRTQIFGGRATLRYEIAPDWTVDLMGVAQSTRAQDSQYADRDGPPLTRSSAVEEGADADYAQGQLVLSGRLGDVRLRSTTGIVGQQLEEKYEATLPGGPPRRFVQMNDTSMVANETRLWQPLEDRFGWVLGVSYTHNTTRLTRALEGEGQRAASTGVLNEVREFTTYGEVSALLFDALVASAGGRFTHARLGGEGEDVAPQLLAQIAWITAARRESAFLPAASLLARVTPATQLYLRYQQGFRPGGLAIEGPLVRRFENDRNSTFELGVRHGTPGSSPFEMAASLSYTTWRDIQADFIDAGGFPSTANIGDGEVWTASFSAGWRITRALRVDAGITYNDSRVDQPRPEFSTLRLTEVPNVARVAGRVGVEYAQPLDNGWDIAARGWAGYVGKSRLGIGPELGDPQGNYLDSGLTVRLGRPDLGVTLGVTNLADEVGNRFALGTPFATGRDQITPLRPRTVRLGLDARF
ncbi:TonB-dependent receptor [Alteraurantiacibacter palmitatis]|uniref:TonB-dependent receptor n=1 Tax=Alteraurantiacibacter palmitatis TaxID=2054628 RepID=A0ABV7E8I8_9SPHN